MENGLYDYSPIVEREPIDWPGGARVAFYVGLNIEHFHLDRPSTSLIDATASLVPDALNYGWRDYGNRIGIWRLTESLDQHGVRASVLLNSDVCERYPQIIKQPAPELGLTRSRQDQFDPARRHDRGAGAGRPGRHRDYHREGHRPAASRMDGACAYRTFRTPPMYQDSFSVLCCIASGPGGGLSWRGGGSGWRQCRYEQRESAMAMTWFTHASKSTGRKSTPLMRGCGGTRRAPAGPWPWVKH